MYDYQYMYVNACGHLQEVDEDVDIDVDVAAAADTGTGKHDDTHIGKEIRHGIGNLHIQKEMLSQPLV